MSVQCNIIGLIGIPHGITTIVIVRFKQMKIMKTLSDAEFQTQKERKTQKHPLTEVLLKQSVYMKLLQCGSSENVAKILEE